MAAVGFGEVNSIFPRNFAHNKKNLSQLCVLPKQGQRPIILMIRTTWRALMIPRRTPTTLAAAASLFIASASTAQEFNNQIGARQGMFKMNGVSIGILAGMARGRIDYDAELAQAAADNLVNVSQFNFAPLWPEGSDSDAVATTAALPAIWDNYDDFLSKFADFGTASLAIQAVASDGAGAIGSALGGLGATCGACHDAYQKSR
jgi:cytochrome c556